MGRGWLKTSEYSHIAIGGLKLLTKKRHMIFERSLTGFDFHINYIDSSTE